MDGLLFYLTRPHLKKTPGDSLGKKNCEGLGHIGGRATIR
jgi:hypothetical protein